MSAPATRENEDHAIIIGIERYRDRDVPPLNGARSDALRFRDWVVSRRGGAVNPENVKVIGPAATAREIRRAFIHLCERAKGKARIGRRLYLYLSGHGIAQNRDETSLFASDGGPGAPQHHIPGWSYASWFMYSAYFREVVLFADCCRTAYRDLPVQPFPLDDVDSPSAGKVAYVKGFAVKYGQSALELDGRRGQRSRGLFTSALVDALKHAYRDEAVTATSVLAYLHNDPELNDWRETQEPSFVQEGELVFARRPPEGLPTFRIELRMKVPGVPSVVGGPAPWTWDIRPGGRGRRYVARLPVGLYAVKVHGKPLAYFEMSAGRGRPTHVTVPG